MTLFEVRVGTIPYVVVRILMLGTACPFLWAETEFSQPRDCAGLPCLPVGPLVPIEAMSAGGQFKQAGGGSDGLHRSVIVGAVFDGHDFIVNGVSEVSGRCVFSDLGLVGEPLDIRGSGRFTEEVSF